VAKGFEQELGLIKNPIIKNIAEQGVELLPDYFFTIPASSTGKYHPNYALGEGGLYRHVRAAVGIGIELFRIYSFSQDEEDLIIASLILHDGWKQGLKGTGNTVHPHPVIASKMLKENIKLNTDKEKEFLEIICNNIDAHMGQWSTCKWDSTVLPVPKGDMQNFVHLADYLSSRKSLEYNFEARK
jgi:23S rRNA maturation-related 3'-5' exoribonuclease YhaM